MDINENYEVPEIETMDAPASEASKIDTTGMSHIEKIATACNAVGIRFTPPRSSCKKCKGKGYVGVRVITDEETGERKSGEAIPCKCIFRDNTQEVKDKMDAHNDLQFTFNRKERRAQEKKMKKFRKAMKKQGIDPDIEDGFVERVAEELDNEQDND